MKSLVFNSRTAIAGAIIGLLGFFFRHDFCYDHMTSQPLFVHWFMQFQLNCMCDVTNWSSDFGHAETGSGAK